MDEIFSLIALPVVAGLLLLLIPEKFRTVKGIISLLVIINAGFLSASIFTFGDQIFRLDEIARSSGLDFYGLNIPPDALKHISFNLDSLSRLIIVFISLFAILIALYSLVYIKEGRVKNYYPYFLITLGCAYGAVLSDNLLLFLLFWGVLGLTLYKLMHGHDEESSATSKKTLILIGASDSIMILGIAIIWKITGSLSMSAVSVPTTNIVTVVAFLALLAGSFTKAGAFPLHTWVPDFAKNAPASSSAYLPASLDKLLGIYFLARITTGMFIMNDWLRVLLLTIGVISIIAAVMMALVQHNYKRLLGYHAVSQVGYMILGFGLGSVIGVAAGLFHMLNNALYKSGLFLTAGCVEYRTGKENIDDLGGLSKAMPVTFIASLIFAMSISGIPPFNGFASKWMIYQGIIEFGSGAGLANKLWVLWLGLAVLGSALTLASFVKLIGGIFLGRRRPEFEKVREVPLIMWIPLIVLSVFCLFFGVFATNLIAPKLLMPVSGTFEFLGFWDSSFVSLLVLISIILGLVLYLALNLKKFRAEDSFIGGEKIQEQTGYATPEFYKTIGEFRFFSWMYKKAEARYFDIYDLSKRFVLWFSHQLSEAHTGVLPGYVIWALAGLIIMLLIMI
jgi:formate hydrogenlyase subunit 3/multisubunit Na+/H+ antiporter MnhD subunit